MGGRSEQMAVKCPQQSVHMTSEVCHWDLEDKQSAFPMTVTGVKKKKEQTAEVRQNTSTIFLSVFKMISLCPMKSMPLTYICSRRRLLSGPLHQGRDTFVMEASGVQSSCSAAG